MPASNPTPNFDHIARPYRWLEYLTFGPLLQQIRTRLLRHLPEPFTTRRRALILGDGDGRFTAVLLALNPRIHAHAVDTSGAMLALLRKRCVAAVPRLHTHQADARAFTPLDPPDLVVTHFFVDCLTQPELDALAVRLAAHASPRALWLLSDFRIPPTGAARLAARILIRCLYLAFRILTGLRTRHLPDHTHALTCAGFSRIAQHNALFGILTTELWELSAVAGPRR